MGLLYFVNNLSWIGPVLPARRQGACLHVCIRTANSETQKAAADGILKVRSLCVFHVSG
jgi:hypothetical protein